MISANSIAV